MDWYRTVSNMLTGTEMVRILTSVVIATIAVAFVVVVYPMNSGNPSVSASCDTVDDVAIVGAGIAGSYAAWRMRNAGLSVSLFEYSNRIGGRCHTVKFPGIPDVNVEMGAMRFKPSEHPLFNKTVHDLGLDMVDFRLGHGHGSDTLYYLRGKHLRYSEIGNNAPYDLHPHHRIDIDTLNWEIFKNYTNVDVSAEGYASTRNTPFYRSLDGTPLYKQSRESFYAKYFTTDTVRYIQDTDWWGADFGDAAAANQVPMGNPAGQSDSSSPVKTVASGYQSVPETMVDQFLKAGSMHSFHRNHHLRSLVKNQYGVYVLSFQPTQTVRGVTKDIKDLNRKQTCARTVLLAIPRLALEHLEWDALKQPDIADFLKNSVKDANAGKMFFAYNSTWWRDLSLATPFTVSTTPLRNTYDYSASPSIGKGVLLPGYPGHVSHIWKDALRQGELVPGVGDDSLAMTDVGVDLARTMLAEIFNISIIDVQQPDYAIMSIWDKYPIGASWYLWRPGYIWEDVENKMERPSFEDNVFLISNVFSNNAKRVWIEGALEKVDYVIAKYLTGIVST